MLCDVKVEQRWEGFRVLGDNFTIADLGERSFICTMWGKNQLHNAEEMGDEEIEIQAKNNSSKKFVCEKFVCDRVEVSKRNRVRKTDILICKKDQNIFKH